MIINGTYYLQLDRYVTHKYIIQLDKCNNFRGNECKRSVSFSD